MNSHRCKHHPECTLNCTHRVEGHERTPACEAGCIPCGVPAPTCSPVINYRLVAPGVLLTSLSPANGPRYSPNLYKWLVKHAKRGQWVLRRHYRCDWLVMESEDGIVLGAKLWGILCNGVREKIWDITTDLAVVGEVDEGFWQQYLQNGRCAIDPKHCHWFIDDDSRWDVTADGQMRVCLWCGKHGQYLEHYQEPKTRWVSLPETPNAECLTVSAPDSHKEEPHG